MIKNIADCSIRVDSKLYNTCGIRDRTFPNGRHYSNSLVVVGSSVINVNTGVNGEILQKTDY